MKFVLKWINKIKGRDCCFFFLKNSVKTRKTIHSAKCLVPNHRYIYDFVVLFFCFFQNKSCEYIYLWFHQVFWTTCDVWTQDEFDLLPLNSLRIILAVCFLKCFSGFYFVFFTVVCFFVCVARHAAGAPNTRKGHSARREERAGKRCQKDELDVFCACSSKPSLMWRFQLH